VHIGGNVSGLFDSFNKSFIESMPVLLVKQRISVSEPAFGGSGLTGNICDSSLAGWKDCSRRPYIIDYFSLSLTAEALIRLNRPLLKGGSIWS